MELHLLVLIFASACGKEMQIKECVLPKSDLIDWNKMSGTWYEIANEGSSFDKVAGRLILHNIRPVEDGLQLEIDGPNVKDADKPVSYRWTELRPGVYTDDPTVVHNLSAGLKGSTEDAKLANVVRSWKEETAFTDYDNYFFGLQCGVKGEKYVYVHHRNPNPTAADIFQVWRKIIEVGEGWEKIPLFYVDDTQKKSGI